MTDVDRLGHVNNAAYWAPVEEVFAGRLGGRLRRACSSTASRSTSASGSGRVDGDYLWLVVEGDVRSAAWLDPDGARDPEQLA